MNKIPNTYVCHKMFEEGLAQKKNAQVTRKELHLRWVTRRDEKVLQQLVRYEEFCGKKLIGGGSSGWEDVPIEEGI